MAQAGVSANRLELLQIADAVAREKSIDRQVVITAMEDAIQKAAKSRYGSENEIKAEVDPKTGEIRLARLLEVVETVTMDATQISLEEARRRNPAAQVGDFIAEPLPPARFRPRRGAERQASDRAEGARGRARAPIRRIQGPRRRDRQRHRQARRIRQRHRRSRPGRGDRAPRRDAAAREFPLRRPHPRLCLRRAPRAARPADLPVAHASGIHGQAVRAGGARGL